MSIMFIQMNFFSFLVHGNEILQYRLLYARWLLYCDFPEKNPSALPRYSPTKVFGKDFANLVGPMLVARMKKLNTEVNFIYS